MIFILKRIPKKLQVLIFIKKGTCPLPTELHTVIKYPTDEDGEKVVKISIGRVSSSGRDNYNNIEEVNFQNKACPDIYKK